MNKVAVWSIFTIVILSTVSLNLGQIFFQVVNTNQLSSSHVTGQVSKPDLVITDGTVITLDPDNLSFTSLAVESGMIADVTNGSLSNEINDNQIKKIFLEGRTILPGFIDSHSHWIGDRDRVGLSVDEVIAKALSYGWTTISEQFVNQERLNELIQLDNEDRLILRVNAYLPINYQEQRFGEWYQAYQPHAVMSEKVRIAGVKLFMDNGPYFSNVNRSLWFTQEELNPIVKIAHDLGYQISIHSFIDNGTDMALNAIDLAQGNNDAGVYRPRIEHASFLRDDQLSRLDQMNVIISAQLFWHSSDWAEGIVADTAADPIPDLLNLIARWRDVIDQGLTFIGSTDTPWGVPTDLGSSMKALYTVTTRTGEEGLIPPQWMLDQRITVEEALKSITIDAAFGTFQEDVKGSIEIGKLADFVVLSANPLETAAEDLLDISVDMTIIGGEVVYCRTGLERICEGIFEILNVTGPTSTSTAKTFTTSITSSVTSNPFIPMIFTISMITVIIRKRK